MIIQWFVILFLGRRNEGLSDFIRGYLEYHVHVLSYTSWMTDKRPGIMPKSVKIFEETNPEQRYMKKLIRTGGGELPGRVIVLFLVISVKTIVRMIVSGSN